MLAAYANFGEPFTVGPLVGLLDRRADLYAPREAWIDRNAPEYREMLWHLWKAIDTWKMERVAESLKKD